MFNVRCLCEQHDLNVLLSSLILFSLIDGSIKDPNFTSPLKQRDNQLSGTARSLNLKSKSVLYQPINGQYFCDNELIMVCIWFIMNLYFSSRNICLGMNSYFIVAYLYCLVL